MEGDFKTISHINTISTLKIKSTNLTVKYGGNQGDF